jgi:hypothetical protein
MLDRLNLLANTVMALSAGAFYLMIFSNAAPGFNAAKHFRQRSYWTVRIGLSFFVAGSLFAVLTVPPATLSQVVRNAGVAILFAWAAVYHAKKWGVITGVKRVDRVTGSHPVIK